MKRLTSLFVLLFTCAFIQAQDLESELGFIYVKADYLLQTDRYEEAIQEFNKIIDQNASFKDALFKRASAKFAIAAYQGAKNDLLLSFKEIGVTPESILLLGQAQKNLGENDAANNTLQTASLLFKEEKTKKSPSEKMKKSREDNKSTEEPTDDDVEEKEKSTGEKIKEGMDELDEKVNDILDDLLGKNGSDNDSGMDDVEEEPEEEVYKPDMSVNEIFIDEDLTILIKDGLGGSKILSQPNILILSETSGDVSVDVCINENGKVSSAVFNQNKSTLSTQSLVSLAVRKSKEYWFENTAEREICGTIIFRITGRS